MKRPVSTLIATLLQLLIISMPLPAINLALVAVTSQFILSSANVQPARSETVNERIHHACNDLDPASRLDVQPCLRRIKSKVGSWWSSSVSAIKAPICTCVVSSTGKASGVSLYKSSGNVNVDRESVAALSQMEFGECPELQSVRGRTLHLNLNMRTGERLRPIISSIPALIHVDGPDDFRLLQEHSNGKDKNFLNPVTRSF